MDKKQQFNEFDKVLLNEDKPSIFFEKLMNNGEFPSEYPFNMLSDLKNVNQSKEHHPEGNVWNHTMLVIDEAAKRKNNSKNKRVLMWAALLHDVGKAHTTKFKKGRYTAYNHDKVGAEMAEEFLKEFTSEYEFISEVKKMIFYHMHIMFIVKELPFGDIKSMIKDIDLNELALLGYSDRLGRGNLKKDIIEKEEKNVKMFLEISKNYKRKYLYS